MATVGNLFVNIRGDATHLEKTVKKSKGTLAKFASNANLIGNAFRATAAQYRDQRQLAKMQGKQRADMRAFKNDPDADFHATASRVQTAMFGERAEATAKAIAAQKAGVKKTGVAASAAQMRLMVGGVLGVLGLSIAGLRMMMTQGAKVQDQTESDFMQFTARGAALKNQMLMDRIKYVQREDIQDQQADIVETERQQLSRERETYGGAGASFRDFFQEIRRMGTDVVGAVQDFGAF